MSKKILVVDDDLVNVKVMQKRLTEQGYEVVIARDGDVGLERVQKDHPDLIILDVEMPRMNGYFFMSELKNMPDFKDIPVIVITANEEMENAFAGKAIGYLVKPIDFDKFFANLKEIFSQP